MVGLSRSRLSISTMVTVGIIVTIVVIAAVAVGVTFLQSSPSMTTSSQTTTSSTRSSLTTPTTSTTTTAPLTSSSTTKKQVVNLTVGVLATDDAVPVYVAQEKGYFAQQGLNVTIKFMAGGAVIAPAVAQGSVQIGEATPATLMASAEQNFRFKLIAPMSAVIYPPGPDYSYVPGVSTGAMIVRSSSNITSYKDLVGKTIATNTLGTVSQLVILQALAAHGIDPSKANVVPIAPPNWFTALQQGRVDAVDFFEPYSSQVIVANQSGPTKGAFRILGDDYHIDGGLLLAGYFATSDWISSNPGVMKAFLEAIRLGTIASNSNATLARSTLVTYLHMTPEVANQVNMHARPLSPVPYSWLQVQITMGLKYGLLKNPADDATQIVDSNYFQLTR